MTTRVAPLITVAVLTISDRCSRGETEDRSGPVLQQMARDRLGAEITVSACVPDEREQIARTLIDWCDNGKADLILTTGGTGFSPRDVTPEAMKLVIEREAPGLAEAMRRETARITPHAMLSRAMAGIRKSTLIVNLPGSAKAVSENLEAILPALPHGIEILKGIHGANEHHEFKK